MCQTYYIGINVLFKADTTWLISYCSYLVMWIINDHRPVMDTWFLPTYCKSWKCQIFSRAPSKLGHRHVTWDRPNWLPPDFEAETIYAKKQAQWRIPLGLCAVATAMGWGAASDIIQAIRSSSCWQWQQCPQQKGPGMIWVVALADIWCLFFFTEPGCPVSLHPLSSPNTL